MCKSKKLFATSYLIYGFIRGVNFALEEDLRKDLKNNELTFPTFRILWILYFDPNINMSDLTYFAQTNISNVFRQLTKLNENKLVVIETGKDARAKKVSLTEDGRAVVEGFLEKHTNATEFKIANLIDKIPREDLCKFIEVSSLISNELLGKTFGEFVRNSTTEIMKRRN